MFWVVDCVYIGLVNKETVSADKLSPREMYFVRRFPHFSEEYTATVPTALTITLP